MEVLKFDFTEPALYKDDWWIIVKDKTGCLRAGRLDAHNEIDALKEAETHESPLAIINVGHTAYNIAPSPQTIANAVLEFISPLLNIDYAKDDK